MVGRLFHVPLTGMFVRVRRGQHRTWRIRKRALGVLELDGGVLDMEAAKQIVYPAEDCVALRRWHVLDQYVTTQGVRVGPEAPDV